MKKILVLSAILLIAGIVPQIAFADKNKKKSKTKNEISVIQEALVTSSDTLSYTAGMMVTGGLIEYVTKQQGVDSAYIGDFIKGVEDALNTSNDTALKAYNVGINIANQLKNQMVAGMKNEFDHSPDTVIENLVYKGFIDALKQDTAIFTQAEADSIFALKREVDKAIKEETLWGENRRKGESFLQENATKDGVMVTPSGLQYKVIVQGDGALPTANDKVLVNYEGRLVDGTVFDSSAKHGDKPASFQPKQVIKGWSEALLMMPIGSKWELYIPYELGYGTRDMGNIPPFSALIFSVEVVGIDE